MKLRTIRFVNGPLDDKEAKVREHFTGSLPLVDKRTGDVGVYLVTGQWLVTQPAVAAEAA